MTKSPHGTQDADLSPLDPVTLLDANRRHAVMVTATADLVTKTVTDIVAKQFDLVEAEGNDLAKSAAALTSGTDPLAAAQNYGLQCAAAPMARSQICGRFRI